MYLYPYYPKQMGTRKETSHDSIWLNWKHTNANQHPPMKIGTKPPHHMSYVHGSKMDIIGILMIQKWFKENPHGNQHLHDFNATMIYRRHQPPTSTTNEALNDFLATLSKKWPHSQLNDPFTTLILPLPYMHGWGKDMNNLFILVSSNIKYLSHKV